MKRELSSAFGTVAMPTTTWSSNYNNTWNALTAYNDSDQYYVKMFHAIPPGTSHIGTGHTFSLAPGGTSSFNSIAVEPGSAQADRPRSDRLQTLVMAAGPA